MDRTKQHKEKTRGVGGGGSKAKDMKQSVLNKTRLHLTFLHPLNQHGVYFTAPFSLFSGYLWGAAAQPLISHHLMVFEDTADSYWAIIAHPLSLLPCLCGDLWSAQRHSHPASLEEEGCAWASPSWEEKKKTSLAFRTLQVHLVY